MSFGQPPMHTLIRKQEGLNNNTSWSTNTLHIDQNGFVWIATQSGLNRYDGYGIKSYNGTGQAPYDLSYNKISAIAEDRHGIFWLGTQEEGIIVFNPYLESFSRFESETRLPDSMAFRQINRLAIDQHGDLLIGTAFQGLYKYDIEKDRLFQIRVDKANISSRSINNFFLTSENQLIVLAFNGLYLETDADTFRHIPVDPKVFLSDAVQWPDGRIFFNTMNTPFYYLLDPTSGILTQHPSPDSKVICHCIVDPGGQIWLNTHDGLYRGHPGHLTEMVFPFSTDLFETKVNICTKDMMADGKGRMYYNSIGQGAGRWQYASNPIHIFIPNHYSNLLFRDTSLFLSSDREVLKVINQKPTPIPLEDQPADPIFDFMMTDQGDFWVQYVSEPAQCVKYDQTGKRLESFLLSRPTTQLLELNDGRIISGLNRTGFQNETPFECIGNVYERISGKKYPDFGPHFFTQLRNGDIWLATFASGIIRITDQQTSYEIMPIDASGNGKLNSNNPYYIYEAQSGHVLVSTDKGINIWDPASQTFSYITEDNIELQTVRGMVEIKKGDIWILLHSQLWKYSISDHRRKTFHLHPDFKSYSWEPSDLQIDNRGHIYFQAAGGVVRVDPEALENQAGPDPVLFTDFYVNRNRVFPGDAYGLLDSAILYQHSVRLPYRHRDIGFSFVSVQGFDINATYYYRLAGYKDEWNRAPENRTLHFTNLSPGQYRFEVKAFSGNEKWTQSVSTIFIRIDAPWYQRWWAYVLYTLLASSIAYGFYRYRVNELLKYQALRTKISSDLHDDVGTILGSIAMEAEMLSYQSDEIKKKPLLERLSQLSREAMGRMRDTVWAIDSRKDNLEFLTDRIKDYLAETLSRSAFSYQFENTTDTQSLPLSPDVRQNVYLIFKESINNILKHSNGSNVEVKLTHNSSGFVLTIHDNGTPTKPIHTSGLGLSNMKLRAKSIKADLSIGTHNGFTVTLQFKI